MPTLQENQNVRGWLQKASISYSNPQAIANEVYPRIVMPTNKAKLVSWDEAYTLKTEALLRARGTESAVRERNYSSVNVTTYQYGISEMITDEDLQDAGVPDVSTPPMNMQVDAIESNANDLDLRQEIAVVTNIVAQTWADGNSGGEDAEGLWSPAGSTNTFVADMVTGIATLQSRGITSDMLRLQVDYKTWTALKQSDDLRDYVKYTSSQSVSTEMVAQWFNIQKVTVGAMAKNTANENATGSYAQVWESNAGKGMGFLHAYPKRVELKMLSAGAQPIHKMPNGQARQTDRRYDKGKHAWIFESREDVGTQALTTNAAYLWVDTYTT